MMETFQILEHTADIGFEAYGGTEPEVFANAAIALVSIITDPEQIAIRGERSIHVDADDREQLLVRYLNEVLYVIDGDSFLPAKAVVTLHDNQALSATLYGEERTERHDVRTDVKAITYHQLAFQETETGYSIRVFVDI